MITRCCAGRKPVDGWGHGLIAVRMGLREVRSAGRKAPGRAVCPEVGMIGRSLHSGDIVGQAIGPVRDTQLAAGTGQCFSGAGCFSPAWQYRAQGRNGVSAIGTYASLRPAIRRAGRTRTRISGPVRGRPATTTLSLQALHPPHRLLGDRA